MSSERDARIRFLLRKAARDRELQPFKRRLAEGTTLREEQLEFFLLEESEPLIASFHGYYRNLGEEEKLMATWGEQQPFRRTIEVMARTVPETILHVHFPDAYVLGVLPLPATLFFAQGYELLETAGDCIHAVSPDNRFGITIDFYEEGPTGITYELLAWGQYCKLLEHALAVTCPGKLLGGILRTNIN